MAKKKTITISESSSTLKALLRSSRDFQTQKRIQCLLLLKEGRFTKRQELSNYLCIGYSTLKRWLNTYRDKGIGAYLHKASRSGRPSRFSEELHEGLKEKVYSGTESFSSYLEAKRWVKERYDQDIPYQTLREYLIRNFGTKLKSPRKSHHKKDERAIEAFKKTPFPDKTDKTKYK